MKKKVILLTVLAAGLVGMLIFRSGDGVPQAKFVAPEEYAQVSDMLNRFLTAVVRNDARSVGKILQLQDKNSERSSLRQIRDNGRGDFIIGAVTLNPGDPTLIDASGTLPQGSFATFTLKKQAGDYKIVSMSIQ